MDNNFLKEREKDVRWLQVEKDRLMELSNRLVDSRRSFLIPTTAVSATIIAGLLIFISTTETNLCFKLLAIVNAAIFALSIIVSHLYLTLLLSFEGQKLDQEVNLQTGTIEGYKKLIREGKDDPSEYSKALASIKEVRNGPQYKSIKKFLDFFSREVWFIVPNALFIIAFILLFVIFVYWIASNFI